MGGYGAFREFVEKLLSDNGVLEKTVGKIPVMSSLRVDGSFSPDVSDMR